MQCAVLFLTVSLRDTHKIAMCCNMLQLYTKQGIADLSPRRFKTQYPDIVFLS